MLPSHWKGRAAGSGLTFQWWLSKQHCRTDSQDVTVSATLSGLDPPLPLLKTHPFWGSRPTPSAAQDLHLLLLPCLRCQCPLPHVDLAQQGPGAPAFIDSTIGPLSGETADTAEAPASTHFHLPDLAQCFDLGADGLRKPEKYGTSSSLF